jgi:hypothetical protein
MECVRAHTLGNLDEVVVVVAVVVVVVVVVAVVRMCVHTAGGARCTRAAPEAHADQQLMSRITQSATDHTERTAAGAPCGTALVGHSSCAVARFRSCSARVTLMVVRLPPLPFAPAHTTTYT